MGNKTALVTGASRGIGREAALALARAGYDVAACYRSASDKALEVKAEAEKHGVRCGIFQCDAADPSSVRLAVADIGGQFGGLSVLVNSAGICRDKLVGAMSEEEWESVIKTDLGGPFYFMRESIPLMKAGGAVINIASIAAIKGNFGAANYAAAKAGLISLTKSAAIEFGPQKVTVNAVMPGFHLTDMGKSAGPGYAKRAVAESVLGTTTDIKELAELIVFLAGVKTVSGQVFNWDSRII